jgi:hypothetical protein
VKPVGARARASFIASGVGTAAAAALAAWAGKLLMLATIDASDGVFWFGFSSSVALALLTAALLGRLSKSGFGPWGAAAIFTALFSLPLARDVHAAVALESIEEALPYTVGAYVLTLLAMASTRGAALALAARLPSVPGSPRRGWGKAMMFPYLGLVAAEASTLAFAPLLFLATVPLPVPAARPWRAGEAARVAEANRLEKALVVFVDPRFDDPRRLALSREAAEAPETFASSLAAAIAQSLERTGGIVGAPWRRVTFVFPETFLNLEGSTFRSLWPVLAERLGGLSTQGEVDILMGARVGDSNVIFSGSRDVRSGRPMGGVVHAKNAFVPFYESPLAGVSAREGDAAVELDAASGEWLTNRNVGLASPDGGMNLLTPLICYEALFLWRWPVGGDALVLTNHHPFARPGLASALYDLSLRQIARASGARVFLAANVGMSGVFGAGSRDDGMAYGVARLGSDR